MPSVQCSADHVEAEGGWPLEPSPQSERLCRTPGGQTHPPTLTSFRHALSFLDPSIEHLLGRHEEDAVSSLASVHHTQLIYQEASAALHVLPPHLKPGNRRARTAP